MRASLLQIDVDLEETVADRRDRVAALVRAQAGADLVVLPELWPVGAFASDTFATEAEPLDGPTADAMSAAARDAGVWLHAGSIVERDPDGPLYNTSLVFDPDGELRHTYRKIHRFGFDRGEAALMAPGEEIVTVALPDTVLGLATCYDLRFPEQFRLLVDAGAQFLVIPAGWPAKRREHWRLLARARAVESQTYVLACGTAGTHAGVELAGHSMVVDPWGDVLAEAGTGEEVLTVDLDPALVTKTRHDFPVLRDRRLG
ncbi:carbon-nitrogen family hydrolase [Streptomyces sp. SPB162]|uniref:carbon-nitrogen family hydrolase n=1 Tax=Streptomyces sp. SPB162 TaxID=2940560 RepID=UPI0024053CD4|nr:carbon-nitrogen family hydrolase [Streptomyces sp. SPB162]MDF9814483.1 putative amidohydrolase [Streptomyces sp. SPB162]